MDLQFKSSLLITEGNRICDTLLCDILPLVVVVVIVAGGQRVGVCCNLQRFWRRLLLIVKLAWTGWSTAVVFPPHVEEVFHVNPCVTCACDCVYISAVIAVG